MPSQDYGAEKQASNVTTRHIEKEGFTLLASGGDKPLFDIVFVHGLQGDPEETWTHSEIVKEEDPSIQQDENGQRSIWEKGLSLFRQGNPVATKRMRTFWPRDILPYDFPNARILSYGYASKVSYFFGSDKPSHENLTENGRNLMNGLAAHRAEAIGRPLMLITHSLGGLVVKSVSLYFAKRHGTDGTNLIRLFVCQQNMMTEIKTFEISMTQHSLPYFLEHPIEVVTGWAWGSSWKKLPLL